MKIKELLENRHGYDDSGMSLAPGNDEGEDSWVYSAAHDRIGAGDPRRHRQHHHNQQSHVDEPHDVHIDGRKWKTFGSKSHAQNVARKLQGNGKFATIHKAMENATDGATSAVGIATVPRPVSPTVPRPVGESASDGATSAANVGVGAVYNNKPPKQPKNKDGTAKNALDMKSTNLLTGGSIKRS